MKPVHIPEVAPGVAELQMENDLLAHENRILRARMEGSPIDAGTPEEAQPSPGADLAGDVERFRRAYYDLRWLVRRIDRPPLRYVLRRWEGFRVLVERYGRPTE